MYAGTFDETPASPHVRSGREFNSHLVNKKTSIKEVFLFNGGGGGSRTHVREYSALGSTCVADSISLTDCYPTGRENNRRAQLKFSESTLDMSHRELV